jgi:uridine kinase
MLIAGETIPTRKFDFFSHKGKDIASKPITASPDDIIILEGIHGLNPEFTKLLGGGTRVSRVFISATQQLNIDHEHHISTADNRLLRRILRDHRTVRNSASHIHPCTYVHSSDRMCSFCMYACHLTF